MDDQNLEQFNKDPVKNLQYSMSMENRKDGFEIAQKVYEHYFVNDKNKQPYEQYGGVNQSRSLIEYSTYLSSFGVWHF